MSDAKTEAVRDATMSQTIGSSIDKPVSIERCEDGRVAVLGKFVGRVCWKLGHTRLCGLDRVWKLDRGYCNSRWSRCREVWTQSFCWCDHMTSCVLAFYISFCGGLVWLYYIINYIHGPSLVFRRTSALRPPA